MSDPDAWMRDISDIVHRKNQAKHDAAQEKHDREQRAITDYEKARELVAGQPTEAFEQFGSYLTAEGESAKMTHGPDDRTGPWVGMAISDADGKFLDVKLQARVGVVEPRWVLGVRLWRPEQPQRAGRRSPERRCRSDQAIRHRDAGRALPDGVGEASVNSAAPLQPGRSGACEWRCSSRISTRSSSAAAGRSPFRSRWYWPYPTP